MNTNITRTAGVEPRGCPTPGACSCPAVPAAPSQMLVSGATVYVLNERGVNRWSAQVQPGQDDNGKRISDLECAAIARALANSPQPATGAADAPDRNTIRAIFMAHGFTIKDGQTDLKPYVYDAAAALLEASSKALPLRQVVIYERQKAAPQRVGEGDEMTGLYHGLDPAPQDGAPDHDCGYLRGSVICRHCDIEQIEGTK